MWCTWIYLCLYRMCTCACACEIAIAEFDRYNFRSESINLCMQKCSAVKCGTGVVFVSFDLCFSHTHSNGRYDFHFICSQSACASFMRAFVCVSVCNISDFVLFSSFDHNLFFLPLAAVAVVYLSSIRKFALVINEIMLNMHYASDDFASSLRWKRTFSHIFSLSFNVKSFMVTAATTGKKIHNKFFFASLCVCVERMEGETQSNNLFFRKYYMYIRNLIAKKSVYFFFLILFCFFLFTMFLLLFFTWLGFGLSVF